MPNVVTLSVLPLLLSRSAAVCAYADAQHANSNAVSIFFIACSSEESLYWMAGRCRANGDAKAARRPRLILLHTPTRDKELHRRADDPRGEFVVAVTPCLLYTSDAADERSSVDLGGRRII